MAIVIGNEIDNPSSNPEQDCISHHTNTIRKGMNPSVFTPQFLFKRIILCHTLLVEEGLGKYVLVRGCPRGVMVKLMDYRIVVSKFELPSRFQTNTLGKVISPLILPAMG